MLLNNIEVDVKIVPYNTFKPIEFEGFKKEVESLLPEKRNVLGTVAVFLPS